jgi:hypothetical protein
MATAQTQTYAPANTDLVVRTTKAMHYRPGGTSKIQFQGTDLMQRGSGEAKVEAGRPTSRSMPSLKAWKTPPNSASSI